MQVTGVLELVAKESKKGNTYFQVNVGGNQAGNAFQGVVKGFKTGDFVTAYFTQNGAFKNVDKLEKTNSANAVVNTESNEQIVTEIPSPKGHVPDVRVLRMKALDAGVVTFKEILEPKKVLTQTSLAVATASILGLAQLYLKYLETGEVSAWNSQLLPEKDSVEGKEEAK